MTDQIPSGLSPEDVEEARSYVAYFLDRPHASTSTLAVARVLNALIPPPPRPTLADMTAWELEKSRWMQCDVEGEETRAVIVNPYTVRVLWDDGALTTELAKDVTPRPDLPRLTWPDDKETDQ